MKTLNSRAEKTLARGRIARLRAIAFVEVQQVVVFLLQTRPVHVRKRLRCGRPKITSSETKVVLAKKLHADKSLDIDDICNTLRIRGRRFIGMCGCERRNFGSPASTMVDLVSLAQ